MRKKKETRLRLKREQQGGGGGEDTFLTKVCTHVTKVESERVVGRERCSTCLLRCLPCLAIPNANGTKPTGFETR